MRSWCWGILPLLAACGNKSKDSSSPDDSSPPTDSGNDADHDGYTVDQNDCDDADPDRFPGAAEACNDVDDNCNGTVDEGYQDGDADGVKDCLDNETCDGVDNDGDGQVDEGFGDADDDGLVDCLDSETCDGVDNDGDGNTDEGFDTDGDTYTLCSDPPDCDDGLASTHPGAAEAPSDGVDNDCDGVIDEVGWTAGEGALVITEIMNNPSQPDPMAEWFEVLNTTGGALSLNGLEIRSGTESHLIAAPVVVPAGGRAVLGINANPETNGFIDVDYEYSGLSLTNEDDDLSLWAGTVEIDEVAWDEATGWPDPDAASMNLDPWFYTSAENDDPFHWCASEAAGALDRATPGDDNDLCPTYDHDGDGYSESEGDCNDANDDISPGLAEIWYDGVDRNCDGWSDNDSDYDGYDGSGHGGSDCVDTNPAIYPGATEICDYVDNNCNGTTDGTEAVDRKTYYRDADSDGYGTPSTTSYQCFAPSGYVSNDDDCNDASSAISPAATEDCDDGIDNNCDAWVDVCGVDVYSPGTTGVSPYSWSLNGYLLGNVYRATESRVLHSWGQYIDGSPSCYIDLYVYSGSSSTGPWTELSYVHTSPTSSVAWVGSGEINLTLTTGTYYLLGAATYCSPSSEYPYGYYTYTYPTHPHVGSDGGVGTLSGGYYDYDYRGHSGSWVPSGGYLMTYDVFVQTVFIDAD